MTSYIVLQKLESENGNQIIINLINYLDLSIAKAKYEKVKNSKKNIPLVFSGQTLRTQLILLDIGNIIINEKNNQKIEREEILEEWEVSFKNENKTNEI